MQYAMNTLKIELFKQIEAARVVKRFSAYPEYQGSSETFERNVTELRKAIEFLQSAEQGGSPATNSDYATALRVYEEWGESKLCSDHVNFVQFCNKRLNAQKDAHCT